MKNKSLFLSLLLTVGLAACKEEFFDQKPYDSVAAEDAIRNENDMSNATNGMYAGLRSANLYGRTLPFINDLMADNVYLSASNSNRYPTQYNYSVIAQNGNLTDTWTQAYAVILRANNLVNAALAPGPNVDQYRGEALTVRALLYFELVRLFARPYSLDPGALGVPLVLSYDPLVKPARSTVSAVYDQIITDLDQAFALMGPTDRNASYVSKYVAKALLAKVYLYRGEYANARAAALEVVGKGGYTLAAAVDYGAYWNNPANRSDKLETIFEVSADNVNNVGFDALANMYSQNGYGDGLATAELYALYAATDVRRSLILSGRRAGSNALIVNKYQNVSNTNDKDNLKVLRYADVLLVLAEAYYRGADEVNARAYLDRVAQRRDPSLARATATGANLLEAIITERRKELAFEGDRFNDLNRLGRDIRRNDQYPASARTIPITDPRRVAPIPQAELDANPSIRPQQNEGY